MLAALLVAVIPARAGAVGLESGALTQPSPLNCIGQPPSAEEVLKSEEAEGAHCVGGQVPFGLSYAYQIQVSPDERSAYSVAVNGDLIEYARNPANGALTVIGCFSSGPSTERCATGSAEPNAQMEVAAIADPAALVVSPDGKNVYVVTQGGSNAVVEFSRNQETGLLTKEGCLTHESTLPECATTGVTGLDVPYGIAITPNGESVYVTGFAEEAVVEFKRNSETGMLTQLASPNECIGSSSSPCGTKAIGLKEDVGVAVSPDGQNVYVAAGTRGTQGDVAAFARGLEGALEQLSGEEACISEAFVPQCREGKHLQGSEDLVVSPDGKNVYANSHDTNAVVELKRLGSGGLEDLSSPNECVSTEALTGCKQVKGTGGDVGVAISPDGDDVYASSEGENTVAAFARGTEGALQQLAEYPCVTKEATGCEPASANELIGLDYARRLTVSPGGTSVYVAGQSAHAVVELRRSVKPAVTVTTPNHGAESGGAPVTVRGVGFAEGAEVKFNGTLAKSVVNSASSITAVPPAGLSGAAKVTVTNPVGTSAEVSTDLYTFTDLPVVSGVSPSVGKFAAGTVVTIAGTEFTEGSTVDFGGKPALSVTFNSSTSLTAKAPAGEGAVNVTVITAKGTSVVTDNDQFDYISGGPKELGGLDIAGYCSSLGYTGDGNGSVALARGEVGGDGYSYENWACVESDGAEVLIANAGPALSEENICRSQYAGTISYASAEITDSAFEWNCYEAVGGEAPPSEENGNTGGGSGGESTAKIASTGPIIPPAIVVPPPVLHKTGNVAPVSGTVSVKLPGTNAFVPLATLEQVPFGSVIEATQGHVSVTVALPDGQTETGEFFAGEFILRQGPNGVLIAELTGGNFSVCPTARERAHKAAAVGLAADATPGTTPGAAPDGPQALAASASGSHVVRKLWANAHGKFETKGNYAAGAVQGTEWLTEDLCDGTLIKVTRDKVAVTNLVNHRKVEVKTGHHYLAKAP